MREFDETQIKKSRHLLDILFNPQSIALVGASSKEKSVGNGIFRNLLYGNFKGVIYPVNPNAKSILGVKTYASVGEIDDTVDLAIIVVPRNIVSNVVEECGKSGVQAAVVITAGFKEIGGAGVQYEEELIEMARTYNLPLLGPNCLGVINTSEQVRMNATFAKRVPKAGNVSFISQSGAIGVHALEYAASNDIGFAKFVSIGNKAVLNENDMLTAFGSDPDTRVILSYAENFIEPSQFIRRAKMITRSDDPRPILVIKTGTSESGKRAAASHTGALAERDDVLDDLFDQCGVIRVKSMEELFDYALCFSNQPIPDGNRLAIITNAGGPGIIATDEAERLGLTVVEFSESLQEEIKKNLPETVSAKNPVDLVGDADERRYADALEAVIHSNEVDSILILSTPQVMTEMDKVAEVVAKYAPKAREAGMTLVASFAGFGDITDIIDILDEVDVPNYHFGESAVQSIAAAAHFGRWTRHEEEQEFRSLKETDVTDRIFQKAGEEERSFINEVESYAVFEEMGFTVATYELVRTKVEAKGAAEAIGYPLVAKIVSPDVVHKFDVGGVRVGIENEEQLMNAMDDIPRRVKQQKPDAEIDGILIQRMIPKGVEVIMGANYNEHYGHLLMFGLGGTFVEVLKDVTFRLAPLTTHDAREMVDGIQAVKMLEGYRGMPARDKETLHEYLLQLSGLVTSFPEIAEIDLNPVFALEEGACVADARIILRDTGGELRVDS